MSSSVKFFLPFFIFFCQKTVAQCKYKIELPASKEISEFRVDSVSDRTHQSDLTVDYEVISEILGFFLSKNQYNMIIECRIVNPRLQSNMPRRDFRLWFNNLHDTTAWFWYQLNWAFFEANPAFHKQYFGLRATISQPWVFRRRQQKLKWFNDRFFSGRYSWLINYEPTSLVQVPWTRNGDPAGYNFDPNGLHFEKPKL